MYLCDGRNVRLREDRNSAVSGRLPIVLLIVADKKPSLAFYYEMSVYILVNLFCTD